MVLSFEPALDSAIIHNFKKGQDDKIKREFRSLRDKTCGCGILPRLLVNTHENGAQDRGGVVGENSRPWDKS